MKAKLILLAFLGGAIGSALRFVIATAFVSAGPGLWIVNLLGALLLGFVQASHLTKSANLQALLATGFAGGFTTVSGLMVTALLGTDLSFGDAMLQVFAGILVYGLGRILGGERAWSKS